MSRDVWSEQLRIAGANTKSVEEVLTGDIPVDGLQHAGSALLRVERSDALVVVAGQLIAALRARGWTGDAELITELDHRVDDTVSELIEVPAELDELGNALEQSAGSASYIDMVEGFLWPAELLEFDEGPDDFDPESDRWLQVVGLGSRPAYAVMERFVGTIEQPDIAMRLNDALSGSGAFRRFQRVLSGYEAEFTRWHRFRDDARRGRARAWLADQGRKSSR